MTFVSGAEGRRVRGWRVISNERFSGCHVGEVRRLGARQVLSPKGRPSGWVRLIAGHRERLRIISARVRRAWILARKNKRWEGSIR